MATFTMDIALLDENGQEIQGYTQPARFMLRGTGLGWLEIVNLDLVRFDFFDYRTIHGLRALGADEEGFGAHFLLQAWPGGILELFPGQMRIGAQVPMDTVMRINPSEDGP